MAWVVGIGIAIFLLFAFPRQMGLLIALIVLAGVGLFAYIHQQNERRASEIASVTSTARIDPALCPDPSFPVAVNFHNGSGRTVIYISFTLAAYEPGFSSSRLSGYRTSDRIIRPSEGYLGCWGAPTTRDDQDLARYTWSARVSSVRFR